MRTSPTADMSAIHNQVNRAGTSGTVQNCRVDNNRGRSVPSRYDISAGQCEFACTPIGYQGGHAGTEAHFDPDQLADKGGFGCLTEAVGTCGVEASGFSQDMNPVLRVQPKSGNCFTKFHKRIGVHLPRHH